MLDNYASPFGFGPLTDAVIDCVADRHELKSDVLAVMMERLPEDVTAELNAKIEAMWDTHFGPAVDRMEDVLSEYIDLGAT